MAEIIDFRAGTGIAPPDSEEQLLQQAAKEALTRIQSEVHWHDWIAVGQYVQFGRQQVMRLAKTNRPLGSRYSTLMSMWLRDRGFDSIDKATRSRLLDVMENLPEIETWRATLGTNEREKLNHPDSVLRRWRARTTIAEAKEPSASPMAKARLEIVRLEEESLRKDREIERLQRQITQEDIERELAPLKIGRARLRQIATIILRLINARIEKGQVHLYAPFDSRSAPRRKQAQLLRATTSAAPDVSVNRVIITRSEQDEPAPLQTVYVSGPRSYEQLESALRQGIILTQAFLEGHADRKDVEVWLTESRRLLEEA